MLNFVANPIAAPPASPAQRILCWANAVFLFVSPFTSSIALRNVSLAIALIAALTLVFRVRLETPRLPRSIFWAGVAWASICAASFIWSIDPTYTANELRPEVLFPLIVFGVFWVGARCGALRIWIASLLAGVALLGMLALGELIFVGTWNPNRLHAGVGAYSTWLVMVFPFIVALVLPGSAFPLALGHKRWLLLGLLLALVCGGAYLTLNRIVWPTLAIVLGVFVVLSLMASGVSADGRRRLLAIGGALFIGLVLVFALVTKNRASNPVIDASIMQRTVEKDPRVALWRYTAQRIADAPIIGHGFGRGILRNELQATFNAGLLWHGHNIVLNVLLQTGLVGLMAFAILWGTFAMRYIAYVRAGASALNAIGIIGLAFLAGFFAKNMTDDFLVRHTGLLFWAMNAMLIGYGERLLRDTAGLTRQTA